MRWVFVTGIFPPLIIMMMIGRCYAYGSMFKPFQIPYQSPISDLSLVINRSIQYQKDQNFYALLYICLLLSSQVVGQISPQKNIAIGLLTIHMSRRTRHLILRGGWKRKANWSWPGASQVIGHISLQKDIVLILILIFDFQKGKIFEDTHCKRAQTLKSHLNIVNVNLLSKTK